MRPEHINRCFKLLFYMPELQKSDTLEILLNAAEELFAKQGYDGTTLRDITGLAGVNLAAAHYHLGNKEALYIKVFTRRLQPINESRLARLAQAEQEAKASLVGMEQIIEIMARPLFELAADTQQGGQYFGRILGRCLVEPLPFMESTITAELQPVMARFGQALRRHLPQLAPEEYLWRFSFVIGAMHHSLATLHCMKARTRGLCRDHDHAAALRGFIQFAVGTLTAPVKPDEAIT
jgi:AcrR family transcriptional regulator